MDIRCESVELCTRVGLVGAARLQRGAVKFGQHGFFEACVDEILPSL